MSNEFPFHTLETAPQEVRPALESAMRSQIVGRDLGKKPVTPFGEQIALEDRSANRPRAVRHGQPFLAELTEAFRFQETAFLSLLFDRG